MFDALIQDAETRLGLDGKAKELVQTVLAYVVNPASGGISGFLERFRAAGMGSLVESWLGSTVVPESPSHAQLESVLGSQGGLIPSLVSRLNLSRETVTSALAFLVPKLISRLTPSGSVPSVLPPEVAALIGTGALFGGGAAAAATAVPAARAAPVPPPAPAPIPAAVAPVPASGGAGKWLPWVVVAAVVIGGLTYCNKKPTGSDMPPPATPAPAPEPAPAPAPAPEPAPAPAAAPAADAAAPQGAAVVDAVAHGVPMLQVFFDTGKTEVAAEFADKAKDLVAYLQSHGDAKAVVSGFNDPTGDPAKNAELSKQRAQTVQAALLAAGVAQGQVVLEKPADTTEATGSNAAARRVDVTVRQ